MPVSEMPTLCYFNGRFLIFDFSTNIDFHMELTSFLLVHQEVCVGSMEIPLKL